MPDFSQKQKQNLAQVLVRQLVERIKLQSPVDEGRPVFPGAVENLSQVQFPPQGVSTERTGTFTNPQGFFNRPTIGDTRFRTGQFETEQDAVQEAMARSLLIALLRGL